MAAPGRESRLAGWSGPLPGHRLCLRRRAGGGRKSIDERREKLKVRRMIDGRRLEGLHISADVLEHSIVEKPAQSAHLK